MKTKTLEQELKTLKEMLVQAHNDARGSKKKLPSFGVSMFLLGAIVQTNACLNRLDDMLADSRAKSNMDALRVN